MASTGGARFRTHQLYFANLYAGARIESNEEHCPSLIKIHVATTIHVATCKIHVATEEIASDGKLRKKGLRAKIKKMRCQLYCQAIGIPRAGRGRPRYTKAL